MSIWSSFTTIEPLYEIGYGPTDSPTIRDSYLDLADAEPWYEREALRVSLVDATGEASALLRREQVHKLRDALDAWLALPRQTEGGN